MIRAMFSSLPDDMFGQTDTTTNSLWPRALATWMLCGACNAFLEGAAMYGASFCGIPRPADLPPNAAGQDEDTLD
jgi:hypothetical protein